MIKASAPPYAVGLADIEAASVRLRAVAHRTPLHYSRTFSALCGCQVYLKAENEQRTGSFKIRGAYNKLAQLPPEQLARGVIAASAGNHAQGLALAAQLLGAPAMVVMPESASLSKVTATRSYGAEVVLSGPTYDAAHDRATALAAARGLTEVPAFDDHQVIAGQGTLGLEILEDLPEVDAIVVPVGGGGLISGIALAVKAMRPTVRLYGVQAAGAPSFAAALLAGRPVSVEIGATLADGIAVKRPGALTLPIVRRLVETIAVAGEEHIAQAIALLLERAKLVVEGAGAVGLAALLSGAIKLPGQRVCVVLSGGNIDLNLLAKVIQHGLTLAGRYLVLRVRVGDTPGQLLRLVALLAEKRVNILTIEHHRAGLALPVQQVEVELTLETRDRAHAAEVEAILREAGYLESKGEVQAFWQQPPP
jgi:threonine dehydratase